MLDALIHASGIAELFSDVISVDRAKTYKPDPKCYELVAPALGVANHEVLFVSSNSFDVAGAKRFGFRVVWIERGGAAVAAEKGPTGFYRLLRGRAERLGYPADFRIGTLSDLAPLVAGLGG
jgi:2-haloacid dehalogenase